MKENSNKEELIALQKLEEGRTGFPKRVFFHLLDSFQVPVILGWPGHFGLILCSLISAENVCVEIFSLSHICEKMCKWKMYFFLLDVNDEIGIS